MHYLLTNYICFVYHCFDIHANLFSSLCAASQLNKLPLIHSNLEEDPEAVRQEFGTYLGSVVQSLLENREREEMSIIS